MGKIFPLCIVMVPLLAACADDNAALEPKAAHDTMKPAMSVVKTDLELGHQVYEYWCAPCHTGAGNAGAKAIRARLGEEKSVLLDRTDIDAVYVKTVVRHGFQMMPPFKTVEISDEELDAVAAYVTGGGNKQADQ